jgi:hypothetical protein
MKTETFNYTATAKILRHSDHKEEVLEARDLYLASESIEQANDYLNQDLDLIHTTHNLDFLEAQFTKEGEGIRFCIGCVTYRILGDYVTVETELQPQL